MPDVASEPRCCKSKGKRKGHHSFLDARFPTITILMKSVPAPIAELEKRFVRNLSACEHAQADRGEYLHVCCDRQAKTVAVPISPRQLNSNTRRLTGGRMKHKDATLVLLVPIEMRATMNEERTHRTNESSAYELYGLTKEEVRIV